MAKIIPENVVDPSNESLRIIGSSSVSLFSTKGPNGPHGATPCCGPGSQTILSQGRLIMIPNSFMS